MTADVAFVPRADRLRWVVLRGLDVDDDRVALLEALDAVVPVPRISGVGAKFLAGFDQIP